MRHCCKHPCKIRMALLQATKLDGQGARCPGHSNCMGGGRGCNNGHSNFMRIASILCGCALLHVALPFKLRFLALLYIALPFKLRFIFRMQTQGYICILICNNGCNNGHSNLQQCLQQSQHQCLDFGGGGCNNGCRDRNIQPCTNTGVAPV